MSTLDAGLALAAVAAVGVNAGYVVQHAALADVGTLGASTSGQTLRVLLGSRRWRIGALLGYGGLGAQLLALALAPAWAVQSVLAAGLVVALAAWARHGGTGTPGRQLLAVAMLAAGLALVVASAGGHQATVHVPVVALGVFVAVALGAVAVAAGARDHAPRTAHPTLDATAAGVLYGVTTVAMATAAVLVSRSIALAAVVLLAGGACAVTGLPRFQRALQAVGPARAVLLMSAAMNATALTGALVLAGPGALHAPALAGLVALAAAGVVAAGPAAALDAGRYALERA